MICITTKAYLRSHQSPTKEELADDLRDEFPSEPADECGNCEAMLLPDEVDDHECDE